MSQDQMHSPVDNDVSSSRRSPHRGVGAPLKKGPWTDAEDAILMDYVKKHGVGNWNAVRKNTELFRCGKSCRLRWANHLRPNLKKEAFTPEEERLIIQLHAKLGNKWSRMAIHLPGRTDNEIKNYWNTRKKRCERASLPIYPAGVRNQSSNEDQQLSGDLNGGENMSNDLLSGNSLCLPDFNNDSFLAKLQALPPQLPAVSISNLLGQSFASKGCSFMDQVDQAGMLKQSGSALPTLSDAIDDVISSVDQFSNDSEKLMQTLGFGYLNEANATSKSIVPFGVALTGSHAPLNGIFSASRLTNGPSKMEPPSVQNSRLKYTVDPAMQPTELVDPYMQSLSATPSVKSECASPRNSGLFEELLHEPHALRSGKSQQPSVRSSSSSAGTPYGTMVSSEFDMGQEYWEEQPGSLLSEYAHFSGNYLAECAPPVSAASTDIFPLPKISPAESPSMGSGEQALEPKHESAASRHLGNLRHDALFSGNTAHSSSFNDTITMLIGDVPVLGDGIVLDSSSWDNMPHAFQMAEFK